MACVARNAHPFCFDSQDVIEYAFSSVIDESLFNVTSALKLKGMWDNTLLVVSSDNGGPAFSDQRAASNFPLRGGKYTYFEGGLRTTAFVTGGLLPAAMRGGNVSAPIHVSDWYRTFCGLAGVDADDDHPHVPSVDSVDVWPLFSAGAAAAAPPLEREIFLGSGVLLQGRLKLIAASGRNVWGVNGAAPAKKHTKRTCGGDEVQGETFYAWAGKYCYKIAIGQKKDGQYTGSLEQNYSSRNKAKCNAQGFRKDVTIGRGSKVLA